MTSKRSCEDCWDKLSRDLASKKEKFTGAQNSRFIAWVVGGEIKIDPSTHNGKRRITRDEFIRCCERAKNNPSERTKTVLYNDICKRTSSYCASLVNEYCFGEV